MSQKVAIFGCGVAGMTAAHELLERGYEVTIYEKREWIGGKARSLEHEGLPAEHGFRFFPGFYKHIPDSMKRTPAAEPGKSTFDHLVWSRVDRLAFSDGKKILLPPHFPTRLYQWWLLICLPFRFLGRGLKISDGLFFFGKMWRLVTSSWERRNKEYEKIGWLDYVEGDSRSKAYRDLLAVGPTRVLVASKAELANTKTVGNIALQLTFNTITPGVTSDRLLDGPTDPVWLDRWFALLRDLGLQGGPGSRSEDDPVKGSRVRAFHLEDGAIDHVEIELIDEDGVPIETQHVKADYYLSALPVDVMGELLNDDMTAADPHLAGLEILSDHVNWMNGIQFYFAEDIRLNEGHIIVSDSKWALTGLSQQQFWPDYDLGEMTNERVRGCISVDISDWDSEGIGGHRPAKQSTRDEIVAQVWAQLQAALPELENKKPVMSYLDEDIQQTAKKDRKAQRFLRGMGKNLEINQEPLLVNLKDSWKLRPDAATKIPNLFLASDYVRTHTDLASMEAANEAARRAVNGILDASGSDAERVKIFPLKEWKIFLPFKWLDRRRFDRGKPWSWFPLF